MTRIFTRIFLSYLLIGMASATVITVIYYLIMQDALVERTYDQLSSINILKKERLDEYFQQAEAAVSSVADHLPTNLENIRQDNVPDEFVATIRELQSLHGFTSVSIHDSALTPIFSSGSDHIAFADLLKNTFSANKTSPFLCIDASIIAAKPTILYVFKGSVQQTAVYIVVEDSFENIQSILNQHTGMGASGESYLVGPDRHLRSQSRFFPETVPTEIMVNESAAYDSLHITHDYRDIEVLSVRRPLANKELHWSIYSEINLAEAMKPVNVLRNYLMVIFLALVGITAIVAVFVSREITKPILYLRTFIVKLSKGVIPDEPVRVSNSDEIRQIAEAVQQLIGGLKRTTQFAYAIGAGKYDVEFEKLSENDMLGDALLDMRNQIKALNELEVRLVREKAAALVEGQENERKRITRELHDGVGQLLTVIRLRLQAITGHETIVDEIKSLLAETIEEVKRISFSVMPSALVDFGLEAALQGLCNQVRKSSSLTIDLQYVRETDRNLSFEVAIAAYRIAQEGLNNILKHAGAQHVDLHIIEKDDELFLLVEDDGKGFDKTIETRGYGLRSMEERAKLLGGSFDVHSEPGKGTAIEVHLPIT